MPRSLLAVAALLLTLPALASCGSDDDDGGGGGGPGRGLDGALAVLPGAATGVTYVDLAAMTKRLDLEGAEPDEYLEKVRDDAVAFTDLAPFLKLMAESAAFDERDVEWSATAVLEEGLATVYRVSDDVDLDQLVDDLAGAGLEEGETRGRRHLTGSVADVTSDDGLIGAAYPVEFYDVTIDDEEHLVIVGSEAETVLTAMDGDEDSAADAGTFDDVLEGVDDVEYADLTTEPVCASNPPEVAAGGFEGLDLQAPEATAYLVAGDVELSARLAFGDDDSAENDLSVRTDYLREGLLVRTAQPFSDFGTAELERDGSVVLVDLDLEQPGQGRQMAATGDGFLACDPAS